MATASITDPVAENKVTPKTEETMVTHVLSDDQIRLLILTVLHKSLKKHPITEGIMAKEQFVKELPIPEEEFEFNMWYLEQKKLIVRSGYYGEPIWTAKITALGVDAVEHSELFTDKLPFTKATINIAGNVYGNVVQAVSSTVTFSQQVTDAFKQAYDQVERKANLVEESKKEIVANLHQLEEELKEVPVKVGKVQKTLNWLKENAVWVVPTLTQIVIDGLKIALGFDDSITKKVYYRDGECKGS